MELKTSEIKHFQQLYMTKFGVELDEKTARYKLLKLVRQMYVVYQPISQHQLQDYNAKNVHINEDTTNEQSGTASNS